MRLKVSPRLISALVVALVILFLINKNWGGASVNAKTISSFLVVGIALGGIYAITAGGLVVT